jgi:circadian clock protein KaiB
MTPGLELRLYVAGDTPKSQRAIANLRGLADASLPVGHRFEIIDLLEYPELAARDQILAIPTLVRLSPLPVRKVIGDLSSTQRVLDGLGIEGPLAQP